MIKGGHGMVEDDRGVILERDELSGLLRRLEAGGCRRATGAASGVGRS